MSNQPFVFLISLISRKNSSNQQIYFVFTLISRIFRNSILPYLSQLSESLFSRKNSLTDPPIELIQWSFALVKLWQNIQIIVKSVWSVTFSYFSFKYINFTKYFCEYERFTSVFSSKTSISRNIFVTMKDLLWNYLQKCQFHVWFFAVSKTSHFSPRNGGHIFALLSFKLREINQNFRLVRNLFFFVGQSFLRWWPLQGNSKTFFTKFIPYRGSSILNGGQIFKYTFWAVYFTKSNKKFPQTSKF